MCVKCFIGLICSTCLNWRIYEPKDVDKIIDFSVLLNVNIANV